MSGDKSTGQIAGGIVGAGLGFLTGGPTGALYGYSIGSGIGGYIDPPPGPTIEGPRLNDLSQQTASYGTPIPRIYGTMQVHGNIFWLENNRLKETVKKKKQGGKGGVGGAEVKTYTYYATFALSLCEGPIDAVSKIWINGRLIYNAKSSDLATVIASNKQAEKFRFYYGSDDQLPDSRMQADVGAANCPAYRGLAYIVFRDLKLTDYGNTLQGAQIKVEVISSSGLSGPRVLSSFTIERDTVFADWRMPDVHYFFAGGQDYLVQFNYRDSADTLGRVKTARRYGNGTETSSVKVGNRFPIILSSDINAEIYRETNSSSWFSGAADSIRVNGAQYWPTQFAGPDYYHYKNGVLFNLIRFDGPNNYWRVERLVPGVDNSSSVAAQSATYVGGNMMAVDDDGNVIIAHSSGMALLDGDDLTELDTSTTVLSDRVDGYAFYEAGKFYGFERNLGGKIYVVEDLELVASYDNPTGVAHSAANSLYQVYGGVCCLAAIDTVAGGQVTFYHFDLPGGVNVGGVTVGDVVSAEFNVTGILSASDYDVTDLTTAVRGFRVPGVMTPRAAISPLQGAYPFDIIPSGYQIKGVSRGNSSVVTIDEGDLDARPYGSAAGVAIEMSREMDSQLPRKVIIRHLDPNRNGDLNEQYSPERLGTQAQNIREFEMPMSLTPDEAAKVAEVLWEAPWIERDRLSFRLPPAYLAIEPADVVTLQASYATFQLRIEEINYQADGSLSVIGRPDSATAWTSAAVGGSGNTDSETIDLVSLPQYVLFDIPLIRDADDETAFAAAMAGTNVNWPGGVLFRSVDSAQTWNDVQAWSEPVTMGFARNVLSAISGAYIDRISELQIDLLAGSLDSITEAQMMTGLHWFAYGVEGRWELCRFATATLESDGSYTLSTMIRGARGTEWAAGLHEVGDYFIFLDDADVYAIGASVEQLGVELLWRGISQGQEISEAPDQAYTYQGVNLRPLSPVHVYGEKSGDDLLIGATRRSRYTTSWWTTGVERPLGETSESWEIDIFDPADGETVVRTLSGSSLPITYTQGQQVADLFDALTVDVAIYQMSATVGRGYPAYATLATTIGDPYFANVVSLLHFEGADSSTTLVDQTGKTWTANGNAQLDTDQAAFGNASGLFDGNGDYWTSPAHADFGFGAGDYTVEGWYRPTSSNTNGFLADFRVAAGNSFMVWCSQSGNANRLGWSNEVGTGFVASSTQFTLNAWNHWAVTRSGTTVRGFVNGVLRFTTTDSRTLASPQGLYLGSSTTANQGAIGNIDEVRITKGVARYTANFTPPTAPFPDS